MRSESAPERRQVSTHDREVVVATDATSFVRPSIGSSTAVRAPVSRATVSATRGETSVSKKIVVAPLSRTRRTAASSLRGVGSASGETPANGTCTSP